MRKAMMLGVVMVAMAILASAASAETITWKRDWTPVPDDWDNAAAWTDSTNTVDRVPEPGDDARIGDVRIDTRVAEGNMDDVTVNRLDVAWRTGQYVYDFGTLLVNADDAMDAPLTVTTTLAIGSNEAKEGSVTQEDGTVACQTLVLAAHTNATWGKYYLNDGRLNVGGNVQFGVSGISSHQSGNIDVDQGPATVALVGGNFDVNRGYNDNRTWTLAPGAVLDVTGAMTVGSYFNLTNNGGAVDIGGKLDLATHRHDNLVITQTAGTMDIGGQLDMANNRSDFVLSGGIVTAQNFAINNNGELTISGDGVFRVLQTNYGVGDATIDIGAGRIIGTDLVVSTVDVGGRDYTQINVFVPPIPEPAALSGVGFGLLALRRLRRRRPRPARRRTVRATTWVILLAAVSAGVWSGGRAGADTVIWGSGVTGNWNVGGNWVGGSIPAAADEARIGGGSHSTTNVVTLQAAGAAAVATDLYVGWRVSGNSGSPGELIINAAAPGTTRMTVTGDIGCGGLSDGNNGRKGVITQNSGVVTAGGTLILGIANNHTPDSAYNLLLGGTLNVNRVVFGNPGSLNTNTGPNVSITQGAGTTLNVTTNYDASKAGASNVRTHTVGSGAVLDIDGAILVRGVYGLTNNGGRIDVAGAVTAGTARPCAGTTAWSMTGGKFDVGGLFDFDDLDMTISGGVLTAHDLRIRSASVLTISDLGIVRVLQTNYSTGDALTDIGNSRIVGTDLIVTTYNDGQNDYTQISGPLPEPVVIPEPAGLGLAGLALLGLRRRRRA